MEGTSDNELSNDDSEQDNENAGNDDDVGSVATVFLPLWEFTEILDHLLVFHAFYKRGAPYDWIDPVTHESRIRLMGQQMMDMIMRGLPPSDERAGKYRNCTNCFTWPAT